MPEMKDFHDAAINVNPIVDLAGRMKELADSRPLGNQRAEMREGFQHPYMIDERTTQSAGCFGVLLRDVSDDFGDVA